MSAQVVRSGGSSSGAAISGSQYGRSLEPGMPWDPGGAGKPASTEAAGRRNGAGSPEFLRGRSSGIHTAPSRVARHTAPDRVASSSPGSPRSRSSGCPPCRKTSRPQSSSRTPGWESAPRSLRSTVRVLSFSQSIRRCSCRKKSRHTTSIPGSLCGRGLYDPSAKRRTTTPAGRRPRRRRRPRCGTCRSCRRAAPGRTRPPRCRRRPSPPRPEAPSPPTGAPPRRSPSPGTTGPGRRVAPDGRSGRRAHATRPPAGPT